MRRTVPGTSRLSFWAVLLVAAVCGAAAAQPVSDAARDEARDHFLAGVDLASAESWEQAAAEFGRSVELFPTAPGLLNLALCQGHLSRNLETVRTLERFLAEFGDEAEEADRRDATSQIAELRRSLATLVVTASVSGARVLVDDEPVGSAPIADPVLVGTGDHVVVAVLDGYETARREVTVGAGDSALVELTLAPVAAVGPDTPDVEGPTDGTAGGTDPVWLWTTTGIAGAAIIATGVTGGIALAKNSEYSSASVRTQAARDEGMAWAIAADVCGGIAIAAGAAAIVLLFTTDWDDESEPDAATTGETASAPSLAFSASPAPGGMALGVAGRF